MERHLLLFWETQLTLIVIPGNILFRNTVTKFAIPWLVSTKLRPLLTNGMRSRSVSETLYVSGCG